MHLHKTCIPLIVILLIPFLPYANDCECAYYEVRHYSRVEQHPNLSEWDEILNQCIRPDFGENFSVTADGTVASKFEVTLIEDECIYDRTDPEVVFIDENFGEVMTPTPEEYGIIDILSMSSNSIQFEYTHPTDLPPAGELFRKVRIGIKDLHDGTYLLFGWMVINVHRMPVVMVHGLWSNGFSYNDLAKELTQVEYTEEMVIAANYSSTNGSSFSENASVVPTTVNILINNCRDSEISAGKVNLVGHSMGGILSRLYLQNNFNNDVHRLVTGNTPHSGAQTANFLMDPWYQPPLGIIREVLVGINCPWNFGAVNDLQVGSPAIASMNGGSHPPDVGVHAIATTIDPIAAFLPIAAELSKDNVLAHLISLTTGCGHAIFDSLFNGDEHDFIVARPSQEGGLTGDKKSFVGDQMHIGSMANTEMMNTIKDLLNEPLSSSKFTTGGYSPPTLAYNNYIGCVPLLTGQKGQEQVRVSNTMSFGYPPPDMQSWTGGDTAEISVSAPGADTIVLVIEISADIVYVQKLPGPEASFEYLIPDEQSGEFGVVAYAYTSGFDLISEVSSSMSIDPLYSLIGITVQPSTVCLAVGDTVQLSVIGHYDDGIDRLLNENPLLDFEFSTWSARATAEDDLTMLYPEDDTLIVSLDTIASLPIEINHLVSPAAAVFWLGGSGLWTDGNNWDIGCPPGPASIAYIQSGSCTIPPLAEAIVRAVEVNQAGLINHGQLSIAGSTTTALKIDKATMSNFGTLTLSNVTTTAIWLNATSSDSAFLLNNGQIVAQTCAGTYGAYLSTYSLFLNDTSGILVLSDCGNTSSLEVLSGVSGFSIENRGLIQLDGGPTGGVGRILNSGTFEIAHSVPATHAGLYCSFLRNEPSGSIVLKRIHNAGIDMGYTTDSLINEGSIYIDTTNFTGMRVATTINSGNIDIRNVADEAIDLEGNNFYFENGTTGSINIFNALTGIYARNTGCQFENHGSIQIDSADRGIHLKFNSFFDNAVTGSIALKRCSNRGIDVADNTSTIFENSGNIEISESAGNGIHVSSNGIFTNTGTGSILLEDIGGHALATSGLLSGNTKITNKGRVDILLPIGGNGIDHTKRFTNDTCGILHTEKEIRIAGSNFVNYGFLHFANTDPHTIGSAAQFQNYGWIEDKEALINPATQVTNHAVLAQPLLYGGCSGVTIPGVFEIGSFDGFDVSDGYTDHTLSTIAGTIDTSTNEFIPSQDGVLSSKWYFLVTDDDTGCFDTIAMAVTPECPVNCTNDPFYWTGCTDKAWDNIGNWNLGAVPVSTDTATITGLPAGGQFPEILTQETIDILNLKPGAQLTVKTGGELIVND